MTGQQERPKEIGNFSNKSRSSDRIKKIEMQIAYKQPEKPNKIKLFAK